MIFHRIRKVIVNSVNGTITVEGVDDDFVTVEYEIHGEADVEVKQEGDTLIVREKPKERRIFGIIKTSSEGRADIWISVPRNVEVEISSVNGPIKAENCLVRSVNSTNSGITLKGVEVSEVRTVNGSITGSIELAKDLDVKAVNGRIELEIQDIEGDGMITAVNGSIKLTLTEFCDVTIIAKTVNGKVEAPPREGRYELRVHTVNGSVKVEVI
ncbi:DUF4097 family beta strand repeat-containing protein [Pyrococcus abyssi]|uniref:DUF4097 domain-containing protein n=1 Tax=Pyrococcus abyssi (strain GE5 / Orsay) TaxID=272844 RepID=Q9UZK9_PYRAB|nr:DUF4097 domain-containing protein [Pyrococcus abyssi]CAB50048.1 Hypothetical protein PAB0753 [Pyrococcus abyssi GE5]CCE70552.1 TPA: hypothetical protein PAB0753 [Pyrococcus abyssi GE5]